ncbi:MAG: hypothetical protein HF314_03995 [Ignavibacteria bacterium]|jgi:hypothetical protein|nr:hypothetical protein [Ignavibacteria bacterium]MCU7502214.1 hypothetical protein [Ignavibacteria bacterium]MCU7517431.1 hypothetical protein [Ignavibacteria bacterium]
MKKYSVFLIFLIITLSCIGCSRRESGLSVDPESTLDESSILKGKVSGVLTTEHSPYRVKGNIEVDSLSTLTIEAGVSILFSDSSSLLVRGRLIADGKPGEPVTFTADNGTWKGIQFVGSRQNSSISYAIIEKISLSLNIPEETGAIDMENSILTIHNSIIRNNVSYEGGGIYLKGSQAEIKNSLFINNHAGIFGGAVLSAGSEIAFINNTVYKNWTDNFGGGLVIRGSENARVENNIFYMNTGRQGNPGVDFSGDSSKVLIKYNYPGYGTSSPLFTSETNLHLQNGSPCIDQGDPDPAFNDTDKSRNDQGAYGGPLGNW